MIGVTLPNEDLVTVARRIRRAVVEMSARAGVAHVASALSCVDILVALYFRVAQTAPEPALAPDRDRIILSKGHASAALYACLAERGFIAKSLLATFAADGSVLGEHPTYNAVPGVEATTGSLGHGLGIGAGLAFAARLDRKSWRVFVVLSDGECNEGSVWEAAQWAPVHDLSNLCAIVDFNGWQATGRSTEITRLEPLADKWRAFGWDVSEIDGHDLELLAGTLSRQTSKPHVVVAHTIKGKGVSFMENDLEWHYRPPSRDDLARALAELSA